MSTDLEKLVVQLSADIKGYEREMLKSVGVTNRQAKAIENRLSQMDKRLSAIGASAARGLIAPLTGIAAALSVREVAAYADAWTTAKNSLSVASVTGSNQVKVLDSLFQSAQDNAAPIGALASLYGKAAQASDVLGASQSELLQFSDGVATALKVEGKSASEATGALTQLGQLLGQTRVQAEEFNSVNEGARPILIAVAAGLDKAGGSVSKLKELVNDGKVSGQQFFQAFLKGLPAIQRMAANSTQTIEQGITKVSNAFTKYIGESDESIGGSQKLVSALNMLADNFGATADVALNLAGVLAAALVGRSIAGMIAVLPEAATAVAALTAALRGGSVAAGLFTKALGPIGLVVGAAAGAALIFGKWGGAVDDATQSLAQQASASETVASMIDTAKRAQEAYKAAISSTAGAQSSASSQIVADTKREFEAKKSLLELELRRQQALVAVKQAEMTERGADLKTEIANSVRNRPDAVARGYSDPRNSTYVRTPNDYSSVEATQALIDASPITQEIKKLRAETDLAEVSANKLKEAINSTFSDGGTTSGKSASGSSEKGNKTKLDDYQQMTRRIAEATAATIAETEAQRQLNPVINDYGFALEKARAAHDLMNAAQEAGRKITPALAEEIDRLSTAYANAAVGADKLNEKQGEIRRQAEEANDFNKDFARGIIDGFANGAKAADVFSDSLKKIGNRLLDLALNDIFASPGKGGGGGGGLSSLFSGLSKLLGFSDGGWTGSGGKYEPAGVVHKGEYVFDQRAVRAAGGPAAMDAMRRNLKGYADGGLVGRASAPNMPNLSALASLSRHSQQAPQKPSTFVIDVRGANGNSEIQEMVAAGVQQGIAIYDKQMPDRVQNINRNPRRR